MCRISSSASSTLSSWRDFCWSKVGPEGDGEPPERTVRLHPLRILALYGTVTKAKLLLQPLVLPTSADSNLVDRFNRRPDRLMREFLPLFLDNFPVTSDLISLRTTSTSRSYFHVEISG